MISECFTDSFTIIQLNKHWYACLESHLKPKAKLPTTLLKLHAKHLEYIYSDVYFRMWSMHIKVIYLKAK